MKLPLEPLRRFLGRLIDHGRDRYQDSKLDYNAAAAATLYGLAFLLEGNSRSGPERYGPWLWYAAGFIFVAGGIGWAAHHYVEGERRRRRDPNE